MRVSCARPARMSSAIRSDCPTAFTAMQLRTASDGDIAFICAQEARPDYSPFINAWPPEKHRAAMADGNYRYQMFVDEAGAVQGFAITRGYAGPNRAIELMRMALAKSDSGRGRAACALLLAQA